MNEKAKFRTEKIIQHISPKKPLSIENTQNEIKNEKIKKTPDILIQFDPLVTGKFKKSKVTYLSSR